MLARGARRGGMTGEEFKKTQRTPPTSCAARSLVRTLRRSVRGQERPVAAFTKSPNSGPWSLTRRRNVRSADDYSQILGSRCVHRSQVRLTLIELDLDAHGARTIAQAARASKLLHQGQQRDDKCDCRMRCDNFDPKMDFIQMPHVAALEFRKKGRTARSSRNRCARRVM